ncbi:transposase [Streptomyces sp. NBC_00984]|uniref:Tn3 family transposase n=1 Tax=Streptomyces sp. NBC_00984 TaxID=2903700 RepID=UPI0038632E82|nr:transposase [Streptomyces sp. NBC_00984]
MLRVLRNAGTRATDQAGGRVGADEATQTAGGLRAERAAAQRQIRDQARKPEEHFGDGCQALEELRERAARAEVESLPAPAGLVPSSGWSTSGPADQEKDVKFSALVVTCVIFHNTVGIAHAVRRIQAEGWKAEPEELAQVSPLPDRAHQTLRGVLHPRTRRLTPGAVPVEMTARDAIEGLRLADRVDASRLPSRERRFTFGLEVAAGYGLRRDDAAVLVHLLELEDLAPDAGCISRHGRSVRPHQVGRIGTPSA